MERAVALAFALLPVAWTAAASAYAGALRDERSTGAGICRRLALGAVVLHALAFTLLLSAGVPPVASAGGLVSATGLAGAGVYLVLERRIGTRTTGVFPVGAAALLSAIGNALGDPLRPVAEELTSPVVALHVAGAVLGYAGLLLASLFGALYLAQRRAMRTHRAGRLTSRLPSLELLAAFCRGSLTAATVFLTLLIGFGHAVRFMTEAAEPYDDPKVLATNLLWLLVASLTAFLWLRWVSARAGAWGAIALLGLAMANLAVVGALSAWHGIR